MSAIEPKHSVVKLLTYMAAENISPVDDWLPCPWHLQTQQTPSDTQGRRSWPCHTLNSRIGSLAQNYTQQRKWIYPHQYNVWTERMYPTTLVEILIRCVTPSPTAFFCPEWLQEKLFFLQEKSKVIQIHNCSQLSWDLPQNPSSKNIFF